MSTVIADYIRKLLFRLRWLIMSDQARYAYLWNRTRSTLQVPYGRR
jgi:hypothetical protein